MESTHPSWAALLERAVTEPGIISSAYTEFHHYSIGNQLLAWAQCIQREIPLGPMATFVHWKELGRHVKRGEKALTLCQPVTIKRASEAADTSTEPEVLIRFMFRPRWFVLAQTEGQDLSPVEIPTWDKQTALDALNVREVPFDCPSGNTLGYARKREISISPLNPLSHKTLFHELAHILLGHTAEGEQADSEITPRSLREAEAEWHAPEAKGSGSDALCARFRRPSSRRFAVYPSGRRPHVLLAPVDARSTRSRDSGAGGTSGDRHDAAVHASESGCGSGSDSLAGSTRTRLRVWRHRGDGPRER